VIKDGAGVSNIGLPEEVELRLRFTTPAATANKVQKQRGKKNINSSEQVCRQKESDVGQRNIRQKHASDEHIMLVFIYFLVITNSYQYHIELKLCCVSLLMLNCEVTQQCLIN